jgi:serine/threonine protein kinase
LQDFPLSNNLVPSPDMTESPSLPKTLGRYDIKRLLGEGAMGSVFLAEDPRIKRRVAIKVVKLDAVRTEQDRKEFLARFEREAEVSGLLNDPGIVTIYDVGESDLGPFLAMEYVEGAPLDALIRGGEARGLPMASKLRILIGLGAALDHAHAHGIVHRDVKPANVMITKDGRPKLMDFGIAKREDVSLTQTGTFLGTPSYACPEQIKDGVATDRSDIFSFGVVAFELLSESLPFPGNSINTILYRIVNEPPVEVHSPALGLLPEAWKRIFHRVLAKRPEDRFPSCAACMRELAEAAQGLSDSERSELLSLITQRAQAATLPPDKGTLRASEPLPSLKSLGPVRKRRTPWLAILGGLAGVAGVLGIWAFLSMGGERVLIQSQPKDAVVFKGDRELGKTSLPVQLRPGDRLRLTRKGYQEGVYTYAAGDKDPTIELREVVSEEVLATDPPGALVVMDEVQLSGRTPLKVVWHQGKRHRLTFTLRSGDSELGLGKDFDEGEVPGSQAYRLLPPESNAPPNAPGALRNNASYPVRVRVDGRDLGEIRSRGTLPVPPGDHRVEISSPGVFLQPTTLTLPVAPGQTRVLALPELASLTVSTFPGSGMVVIDGIVTDVESLGETPIVLVRGRHLVTIKGKSMPPRPVDVVPGMPPLKFRI